MRTWFMSALPTGDSGRSLSHDPCEQVGDESLLVVGQRFEHRKTDRAGRHVIRDGKVPWLERALRPVIARHRNVICADGRLDSPSLQRADRLIAMRYVAGNQAHVGLVNVARALERSGRFDPGVL